MNEGKTTKYGKSAGGQKLTTSSPAGHDELAQHMASEQKGDTEVPVQQEPKNDPPDSPLPGRDQNPKRTRPRPS